MIWIAAERPTAGGLAVLWLVMRFIDARPRVAFVAADAVDLVAGATGGYALHTDWSDGPESLVGVHGASRHTFRCLVAEHHLAADPALAEIARLAQATEHGSALPAHPFGEALGAIGQGALAVEEDDHQLIARAAFIYDAAYAYYRRRLASRGASIAERVDRPTPPQLPARPQRTWATFRASPHTDRPPTDPMGRLKEL